jgi:hypothetical protein
MNNKKVQAQIKLSYISQWYLHWIFLLNPIIKKNNRWHVLSSLIRIEKQ